MKRYASLLLLLAFLLTGCAPAQPRDPANFYYCRIEPTYDGADGLICPEQREVLGIRDDLDALLEAYFSGPASDGLELPFPRETAVVGWEMVRNSLHIELSEAFAQLTGIDLTIACACISKTFLELTDATTVRIRAGGVLMNGSQEIIMSENNLKLIDDSLDKLRTELTLYYTDEDRRYLLGYNIAVNLASQSDIVGYLVHQLLSAPSGLGLVSPLPDGTKLLDSTVEDGVCTLDLSADFETNAFTQSYAQRTTLLSLVNTLTQLEDIERVEFYVEGNLMAQYRQLNISTALVYDESAIGPVRTGVNEFDATLYLSNGSDLYLAAVPTRIRQTAGNSPAELVVNQLIHYQNANSFFTTIPEDTVLNQVTITADTCIVDLSAEFLESDQLTLSIHSIVASVCALEGIDTAQITINGQTIQGDLFQPLSPSPDWYL